MAGIMNNTARQYNLKCIGKNGERVTVRVAPGFNVVENEHWKHFKGDPYVALLIKEKKIEFGKAMDDLELERDPDTKAKSKAVIIPGKVKEEEEEL